MYKYIYVCMCTYRGYIYIYNVHIYIYTPILCVESICIQYLYTTYMIIHISLYTYIRMYISMYRSYILKKASQALRAQVGSQKAA